MNNLYSRLPKYIQIKETIRKEIDEGVLKEGEQLPSEAALIERFGASKMTVIRALQELVQEGYLRRVQGKGTYVTRPLVNSPLIGVLIPGLVHGIFSIILKSIEKEVHELGYSLMLCSADEDTLKVETFAQRLIDHKAVGIIAAPLERVNDLQSNVHWYELFRKANIPVILVDRDIPQIEKTVLVDTNNEEIMLELTREVKKRGHTRMIFAGLSEIKSPTTKARIDGFLTAANESPLAEVAEIIRISEKKPFANTLEEFEKCLFEYEPTVVLTSHDLLAVQVLSLLKNVKADFGPEISLTGFDDLPFAEAIGLTTVRQPLMEEGKVAVDLLHRAIRGEKVKSVKIPSEVVIRTSLMTLSHA